MKIVILGPTGVGKTKLSIELAKYLDAYIINCDATQIYKELNIGSAKIKKEEMENIKHFLIDIIKPDEEYSVKDYQSDIRKIFNEYKDKNFVIVGGTGLYATAAFYDYRFEKDKDIDVSKLSNEELLNECKKIDNNCNIDINNRVRLERFLKRGKREVVEPIALYNDAIFIGLTTDRSKLYEIINKRVDTMINDGLIEEVSNLYKKYPESKILKRAIGYKEVIEYIKGSISKEECVCLIKKNSRHYAKRQYTWFNNKMDLKWFDVDFNDFNKTIKEVKDYIDV